MARDHITILRPAVGVVKADKEVEEKAKAEVKKPEPKDPQKVIKNNTKAKVVVEQAKDGQKA